MLQKAKSKSIAKSKFLILLPLLLGMLVYVSCSGEPSSEVKEPVIIEVVEDGEVPSKSKSSADKTVIEIQELVEEVADVPYILTEEVPAFEGCEDLEGKARKDCTTGKITEYVNANFDTSLGKKLGLAGINKIYVQFRITAEGASEIIGVRAAEEALEEEAIRVVSSLPKMTPGKMKGEAVPVLYSLPIIFRVD